MQMVDFLKQLVFLAFTIFNKVTNVSRKRCNGMRLKQDNRQEWQQQPTSFTKKNIIAYLARSHKEKESPLISDLQMKFKATGNEANAREEKVQQRGRVCWDYRKGNLKQCYAHSFLHKIEKIVKYARRLYVHSMQTTVGCSICVRVYEHERECECV